jgi:hypothetical protein
MLLYNSDFITDMMEAHFKLHYSSNKLLQYSVNIIGDCVEKNDITASKIPGSMFCSYNANFKLTAIKHAEGTSNCDGHESSVLHNSDENRTTNELNSTQKAFCGSKEGNFNDMNDTILEFVLRQMK